MTEQKENYPEFNAGISPGQQLGRVVVIFIALLVVLTLILLAIPRDGEETTVGDSGSNSSQSSGGTECARIQTNVTMIQTAFENPNLSPQQVGLLLDSAASDWRQAATKSGNSERAWLRKMAELSLDVRNYILTGTPENGLLKLQQLQSNMGLTSQFCG